MYITMYVYIYIYIYTIASSSIQCAESNAPHVPYILQRSPYTFLILHGVNSHTAAKKAETTVSILVSPVRPTQKSTEKK